MPIANRTAMFSPFAALTGYNAAAKETARLTDARVELTEEEKSILDAKLQLLEERIGDGTKAAFTYFQPDGKKGVGAYVTVTGEIKHIDGYAREVVLSDGQRIPTEGILDIQF